MKVRWTHHAQRQLVEIGRFIARDKPGAARHWVEALRRRATAAGDHPLSGRVVPELRRQDVREVILGGYRIVYRVMEDHLEILTVFEGHRSLGSALSGSGVATDEGEG